MNRYGNKISYQTDKEGVLTLQGKFSHSNFEHLSFPVMMQDLVSLQKQTIDFVQKALAGDGRLLGQEKAGLSRLIDFMIYNVLAMRLKLDEDAGDLPVSFDAGPVYGKIPHYRYNKVDDGFHIRCKVSEKILASIDSFAHWFNTEFKNKMTAFYSLLKQVMADYEIDDIEKTDLIEELHDILYNLIMLSWKIKSRKLDS